MLGVVVQHRNISHKLCSFVFLLSAMFQVKRFAVFLCVNLKLWVLPFPHSRGGSRRVLRSSESHWKYKRSSCCRPRNPETAKVKPKAACSCFLCSYRVNRLIPHTQLLPLGVVRMGEGEQPPVAMATFLKPSDLQRTVCKMNFKKKTVKKNVLNSWWKKMKCRFVLED